MEEILHQLIGSLVHCLQGFIHPRWCKISAINSMLVLGNNCEFLSFFSTNQVGLIVSKLVGELSLWLNKVFSESSQEVQQRKA